MLNKEKHENKKEEFGKNRKNFVLYLIVLFMLFFSILVYLDNKNLSVQAGSFGGERRDRNVSFYQAGEKLFGGLSFDE